MGQSREQLEIKAQALVQRSGLKSLSFRTLANEVGIKSSSVHYHFPEKSDLAEALIERYATEFFEQIDKIIASKSSLKNKLRAFIAIFEDVAKDDKLCLCGMMAAEIEQCDANTAKLLQSYFTDTEYRLQRILESDKEALRSELPTRHLAKVILSGLEGALIIDRVANDNTHLKAHKQLYLSMVD